MSYLHLIELLRAGLRRRLNLAEVFERFARGWYIAAWSYILPREFDHAIAKVLGLPRVPPLPEIFGRGIFYGLPPSSRENLLREFGPNTFAKLERISELPGATLDMIAFPNEEGRGLQNISISERNRQDVESIEKDRQVFRSETKLLHRRAMLARYTLEFQNQLKASLSRVGHTLESFFSRSTEFAVGFWSEVPSLHVDCELTLYRDRQWSRRIDPNDCADLGHLALSVPYCAAVVVERLWARALTETGVARKFGTTVCTDLEELKALVAV